MTLYCYETYLVVPSYVHCPCSVLSEQVGHTCGTAARQQQFQSCRPLHQSVVLLCRALVAGVNLTMRSETAAVLAKAGMLTPDGRCKTLDASADGYARGEACVVSLSPICKHNA